jgi:agmatinase
MYEPGTRSPRLRFTDFAAEADAADIVMHGIPFEGSVNLRHGADLGPAAIREHSHFIETYSPELDRDLEDLRLFDGGDLDVAGGTTRDILDRVARQVAERVPAGKRCLFLGGDHTVTYPILKALTPRWEGLSVIQLDAHADRQDLFPGEPYNYASVMARVLEFVPPARVFQVGIRTGARTEYANHFGTHFFPQSRVPFLDAVSQCADMATAGPVYVTIDIDVFDPTIAPGTGSPEPSGITFRECKEAVRRLSHLDIVGFDLVEVSPPLDLSGLTSILAACLVRECLLHWWS